MRERGPQPMNGWRSPDQDARSRLRLVRWTESGGDHLTHAWCSNYNKRLLVAGVGKYISYVIQTHGGGYENQYHG